MVRSKARTWDTVVIGSGPGGLTAAVALARAGQRVLVLEQHYLPGGFTHSFTLEGYRFSPGVHYVGELGPDGGMRRMYEGLGLGESLSFGELNPDGFDHFLIAGERIDQPKGRDAWLRRLVQRFPHERAGLERFFTISDALVRDLRNADEMLEFPDILAIPFRAPTLLRWGFRTFDALLSSCIHDPLLKAVLSAQCGNHAAAPTQVSLPLHAAMAAHYHGGAFYPLGGGKRIAAAYIKELRRHGGEIHMSTRVARILTQHGRAIGVVTSDGETFTSNDVVCNADPAVAYRRLLPRGEGNGEAKKAGKMRYGAATMSIFCAVDMDLRALGFDSGNYWYYRTADVDGAYRSMAERLPGEDLEALFLTVTTLKDPTHGRRGEHTIEMFTFVPYEPFAAYRDAPQGRRGGAYEALKLSLADKMLRAGENIVPGLRRHMKFMDVGTPLTNDFYCETFRGAAYGTAKTPRQLGPFSFKQRGPIENLTFCGASTMSHGIAGASISGLVAAQKILGLRRMAECLGPPDGSLQVVPSDEPEAWLGRLSAKKAAA